ncbi:hypothetical protein PGB34_16525 [Xenophilus arseniciresistens]|uniref:Uncharacterized protein n=1 Tax=Xenophilus arseniciresistens TaxID=1283306 RepID=A0AAE3N960_9BURK|nr:hypothetical protein [Xenophilus arseniciresistens]MDA7417970.1 hypothetical protein [Xenophilus arseniciresistens]
MEMKHHAALLLSLLALSSQALAAGEEDDDAYYLRRLTPPPITSIKVTHPIRRDETALYDETCEDFKITARDARRFFRHAQAVSRRDYNVYYPESGCYGKGATTYTNGMRTEWHIESNGRGIVVPTNGKNKGVAYYLYCGAECETLGRTEGK